LLDGKKVATMRAAELDEYVTKIEPKSDDDSASASAPPPPAPETNNTFAAASSAGPTF
jgi:hypothetical protein